MYYMYICRICISSYSRVSGVDMKFKLRPIVGLHTHFPSVGPAHFNIKTQTWLLLSARYFSRLLFSLSVCMCVCATKCLRLTGIVKMGYNRGDGRRVAFPVYTSVVNICGFYYHCDYGFKRGVCTYNFICWYSNDWKIFELAKHI